MTTFPYPLKSFCALMAVALAAGCSWKSGGGAENLPEMHRNFSRAMDVQTAVIQGDLERAHAAGSWLLERESQIPVSPSVRVHEEEMLEQASEIAQARDLETVAARAGQLAAACGSCHQAATGGPRFVVGTSSPGGDSQEAQMIRHLWAADRMWEGLVGPSDEAWEAGANALAETQPALAEALRSAMTPQEARAFLSEVNRLANEAMGAQDLSRRAEVYGQVLNTCRRCHAPSGSPLGRD